MEKNKVNKWLGVVLLFLIFGFSTIILLQLSSLLIGPSKKACTKKVCLAKFLEGPPAFNDESMKDYLRKNYYDETSGPLKLTGESNFDDQLKQALEGIKAHFKGKRDGTFVVLGAGDGEYQDVTLPLERDLGWSGLLVEPHPDLYEKLKNKGRKITITKNCVSPFTYPSMTKFAHKQISPSDSEKDVYEKHRFSKVSQLWDDDTNLQTFEKQCVPLENLIYAAGIEKEIDLLVLDMSGTDLDIILNVRMDILPPVEMILLRSHGSSIGSDVGGFFLDSNIVVAKVFGRDPNYVTYLLQKFQNNDDEEL